MNEVNKIHLGRQPFTIAVDAYRALHKYLEDIKKQPGVQPEVVEEVEMRMAELLTEHGISGDKVVLLEDVDFLKQQLGEPGDFKDEPDEDDSRDKKSKADDGSSRPRRFFRDPSTAMVAGVASGIAAYTGIHVTIIRLIFLLSMFAGGTGIFLYIIIWLLAPEANTPSERLQMQGKAITVDSLKDIVDRADIAGVSERAGKSFGRVLAKIIEAIFRIFLIILGSILTTVGIVVMLWIVATVSYLFIHGGQIGTDIAFPIGAREVWLAILGGITGVIIGFLTMMIGVAMASRKWHLPSWSVAALIGIFLVSGSVGAALGFDTVPHIRDRFQAAHHSQTRELSEFKQLSLDGEDTSFAFVPDSKYYVELSYLGNADTKLLKTDVVNDKLTIDSGDFMKTSLCNFFCFYSDHDLKIIVHAPNLDEITMAGVENSFKVQDPLTQKSMRINVNRHSDNQVKLDSISSTMVDFADSTDVGSRTLSLTGIAPDINGKVQFNDEDNNIHVDETASFRLNTPNTCDESEPLVYLGESVKEININNKIVKSAQELRDLRSSDKNLDYNCVVVR